MNRALRVAALVTAAGLTLGACSALGAESPANGNGKTAIRISMMTAMDAASFYQALDHGYFNDQGLTFPKIIVAKSGGESVSHLTAGEVDIAFGSWSPFLLAQDKGVADIKLIADGTSSTPNTSMLMVAKGSRIKTVQDLASARIGITAKGTLSELLPRYYLDTIAGVKTASIQWVEIGFDAMAAALAAGQLDAASMVEPFVTAGARQYGIERLQDVAIGPNGDFPLTGYGTTATWAKNHHDLVEGFQKAMQQAAQDLLANPDKAREVLGRHSTIPRDVLDMTALPRYEASLDPVRLGRAVRLMNDFGQLAHVTSVDSMLLPGQAR